MVSRIPSVVDLPRDNTRKYPLSTGDNTPQFGQQKGVSVQGICEKTALAPSFSNSNFILSEGDYFSHHLPSTDQIKIVLFYFFTGSLDHRKTSGTVVSLESMKLAKLILFRPWTVRLETIRAPRLSGLLLGHRVKLLLYS